MGTEQENFEFHEMMSQNKKAEKMAKRAHDARMHSEISVFKAGQKLLDLTAIL
jgi:hypothetical protein